MTTLNNASPTDEEWRKIDFGRKAGNHRVFEISNYGRIRTINKKNGEWKFLSPSKVRGYQSYSFKLDRPVTKLLHRLVAEAFIEKEHIHFDHVIHLDYNKSNNHFSNLKWVTKEGMFAHLKKNPDYKGNRKRRITNSKLTESKVKELKTKLNENNTPLYKLAEEFGITHTQLNRIRHGQNWGHVSAD
ncbi:MAG: NUMOD4 domain-containing protein [Bacteroidota bacterium]